MKYDTRKKHQCRMVLLTDDFFIIHPASFITSDMLLLTSVIHTANGCGHVISKARTMYTAQWQTRSKGDNCVRHSWIDIQKFFSKRIVPYISSGHIVGRTTAIKYTNIQYNKARNTCVILLVASILTQTKSKPLALLHERRGDR